MAKKAEPKLIGYARVSTEDQNLRVQIDELEKAGCWNIWQEKRSATRGPRPEFEKALMDLRPGDTLIVWRLDRLIRHARDLYTVLDRLEEAQATVRSLSEPHLDILTPIGEFMMGMTALLAQLEVRTLSRRTARGIKAIQDRGMRYGAKPKLSDARAQTLLALRKAGWSFPRLASKFNITPTSARNYTLRAKRKKLKP